MTILRTRRSILKDQSDAQSSRNVSVASNTLRAAEIANSFAARMFGRSIWERSSKTAVPHSRPITEPRSSAFASLRCSTSAQKLSWSTSMVLPSAAAVCPSSRMASEKMENSSSFISTELHLFSAHATRLWSLELIFQTTITAVSAAFHTQPTPKNTRPLKIILSDTLLWKSHLSCISVVGSG